MVHKEFDQARALPENQDPVKRFALDRAEEMVLEANVLWPVSEPVQTASSASVAETSPRIEVRSVLETAGKEYGKKKLHTPEEIHRYNQVLWNAIGHVNGEVVIAPVLSGTKKDIELHEKQGRGILLVAEGYSEQRERHKIARAFGEILGNTFVPSHWSTQVDNPVKNDALHTGYRAVDMQLEAPNTKTTEDMLSERMQEAHAEGMNHSEYLLASLMSKLTTGHYLDEKTYSRLSGSSRGGHVVGAGFGEYGGLDVDSLLYPQNQNDNLGGRFSLAASCEEKYPAEMWGIF